MRKFSLNVWKQDRWVQKRVFTRDFEASTYSRAKDIARSLIPAELLTDDIETTIVSIPDAQTKKQAYELSLDGVCRAEIARRLGYSNAWVKAACYVESRRAKQQERKERIDGLIEKDASSLRWRITHHPVCYDFGDEYNVWLPRTEPGFNG